MTDIEKPLPVPPPTYRLYSPAAVVLATVIGGLAAGGVVLALNYWRWRQHREAWYATIGGILGTIILLGLAVTLPDQVPAPAFLVPQLILVHFIAKQQQGSRYEAHLAEGGRKASNWKAVGIGALFLLIILAGFVGWFFLSAETDLPYVEAGPDQKVHYVEGATREKAQALADALKKEGIFGDSNGATVVLSGTGENTAIGFVVKDGGWDQEQTVIVLGGVVEQVAPSVGGKPITLRFLNGELEEKKRIRIDK
jgi:uncharacterized integral membrane protein